MRRELRISTREFIVSGWYRRTKKWRPQCQAVKYSLLIFEFPDKLLSGNVLRFNPIQIAEWLFELLEERFNSQGKLADDIGLSRTRVEQFLYLLRIPIDLRSQLKQMPGVTEVKLRPLTKMDGQVQRGAVERMLGMMIGSRVG
jgi:hypothetical protein